MRLRTVETTVAAHVATVAAHEESVQRQLSAVHARVGAVEEAVGQHSDRLRDLFVAVGEARVKFGFVFAGASVIGSIIGGVVTHLLTK